MTLVSSEELTGRSTPFRRTARSTDIFRRGNIIMSRGFVGSAVLTLAAGLLLGQTLVSPVGAQRRPASPDTSAPETALIAPPLISAPGAEIPVGLRTASVQVETDGGLARTTLLLTLYNPNDRQLEGTLEFPLQPGQQVSAFALDIGGELRDAVPVPKQKAQQVFESIERRNVDPGLLEQTAGNHFRLRVYPIPARGTRQVRLAIDEALRREDGAWRLDVPVQLLADADHLSLAIRVRGLSAAPVQRGTFDALRFERIKGGYAARYETLRERLSASPETRRLPPLGFRLPAVASAQAYVQAFDGDRFALVDLPLPAAHVRPRRLPSSVGLLWDASGSARKRDRQSEFALLDRYFKAMGEGSVTLRLLRDVGEDGGRFEINGGEWSTLRKALENTVYDGASDLADWTPEAGIGEYLLVSDGLRNYGDDAFPALREGQSLYALSSAGANADATRLSALAEARGGRLVQWQGRDGLDIAASALLNDGTRIVGLEGEGIEDLKPQAWAADGGLLRIAGRLTEQAATVRVRLREGGKLRSIEIPVAADAPESNQVAPLWASWQVAAHMAEPERHRAAITRLGQRFGLVTPGTSLLVLEAAADYVRYDIPAPAALRTEVDALRRSQAAEKTQSRSQRLEEVALRFAERQNWFSRKFPKGALPKPEAKKDEVMVTGASVGGRADAREERARRSENETLADMPRSAPPPSPPPPPPPASMPSPALAEADAAATDAVAPAASRVMNFSAQDKLTPEGQGVSIQLQAWAPDSPYARRLREAKAEDLYRVYLDERDSHASSTAFYLDVADLLLRKGRRADALRVLSNLAELDLENRHVLRVLGYRLMQAKDYARAVEVFRDVLRLADEEPQSHRDLGLALAAAGQRQEGIERLYEVAARPWDSRFSEVELVALNELNAIIAASPQPLDAAFIDRRLLRNMPLDLRVVLGWDSDNSDMDLWVTDPNGERCYYGNRNTYQGGLISDDFTGGYGPEEFVLRDAKPGKYKVEANFFGDRQQIVTGATTLSMMFSTGWGTRRQQDQSVTLRLSGQSETVFVGEFEVK
jgi:Ca-activated chloride channel homolog